MIARGVLMLAQSTSLWAFPGRPLGIVDHYLKADVVVIARAMKSVELKDRAAFAPSHETTLTVERRFKGPHDLRREIIVGTNQYTGCPYDARFDEGRTYYLLLQRWKPGAYFRTVYNGASAYVVWNAEDATAYAWQAEQLGDITSLADGDERRHRLTEFFFTSLHHPTLRNDAFLLSDRAEFQPNSLSESQGKQLVSSLLVERPPHVTACRIVDFLAPVADRHLTDYLIDSFRHADESEWLPIMERALDQLPNRLGFAVPAPLGEQLERNFNDGWYGTMNGRDRQMELARERRVLVKSFLSLVDAARKQKADR